MTRWQRQVRQRLDVEGIASTILAELLDAAKGEGVTFDDDQVGFIEQALSDAALEAFLHILRELREIVDPGIRRTDLEQR